MSNIQPDSVIACLDSPAYIQSVLNASMWAAKLLRAPLGLLHAVPVNHRIEAVDYSGCLLGDDGDYLLNKFTSEEKDINSKLRHQGRELLQQSAAYCENKGRYKHDIYALHRHATIAESLDYVDDVAQLIVIGHQVTCKSTLPQLVRASKCPTLVTQVAFQVPKSALFAFDNSSTCQALLDWLCRHALVRQMEVHVVMIGKLTETNKDAVREAYARLKQAGISCKKALIEGRDVTSALLYYQKKNELEMLITGAFGESRLRELLYGSDTQKLLGASKTPYLLYPRA